MAVGHDRRRSGRISLGAKLPWICIIGIIHLSTAVGKTPEEIEPELAVSEAAIMEAPATKRAAGTGSYDFDLTPTIMERSVGLIRVSRKIELETNSIKRIWQKNGIVEQQRQHKKMEMG